MLHFLIVVMILSSVLPLVPRLAPRVRMLTSRSVGLGSGGVFDDIFDTGSSPQPQAQHQPPTEEDVDSPPVPATDGFYKTIEDPTRQFMAKASGGEGSVDYLTSLTDRMSRLEDEMHVLHGSKFNIGSPSQLSVALFGVKGESTNKDVLDAMAGAGNPMAGKALEWRRLKGQLKRAVDGRERQDERRRRAKERVERSEVEGEETEARDPLLLVDASAYIFRAYYAMPPLHRKDGTPTGAVLGFCNMINRLVLDRLIRGERPRLVLVFDAKGKNFRHDIYKEYKANRPPCPIDLVPQFDLVRSAASAFGIRQLDAVGYEADDVIATLATEGRIQGVNVNIVSSDKDLMQLVTPDAEGGASIHLVDPMKQVRIDHDAVIDKWGVPAHLLGDVLALAGDSADNVPGIRGIGPKIAAELLTTYGDLESLLKSASEVKQKKRRELLMENAEVARMSRELVELVRDVPSENVRGLDGDQISELRMEELNEERLLAFFKEMGFGEMRRRVEARFKMGEELIERSSKASHAEGANSKTRAKPKPKLKQKIEESEEATKTYQDVPF